MAEAREARLLGRLTLNSQLYLRSGLLIGGTDTGIAIGGLDKVVVRNVRTNQPYVPGSSLKGKLRSLLERALHKPQNRHIKGHDRMKRQERILIHSCEYQSDYDQCGVCQLFGVPSNWEDKDHAPFPTRIISRDGQLSEGEAAELRKKTELPYTEAKTEVGIDRLTSAANPRTFERVPADTKFDIELVINFYQEDDGHLVDLLLMGMDLLEGDYLGGQGSRGYGAVQFQNIKVTTAWFCESALKLPDWVEKLAQLPYEKRLVENLDREAVRRRVIKREQVTTRMAS